MQWGHRQGQGGPRGRVFLGTVSLSTWIGFKFIYLFKKQSLF